MTKKEVYVIAVFLIVLLILLGCNNSSMYILKNEVVDIDSIEIVSASSCYDYTTLKTLSQTEMDEFLVEFSKIEFSQYIIGDPMSVSGDCIKINYKNGSYEIICHYWAEYVENETVNNIRKNCDEEEFNRLLLSFLDD